MVIHMKRKKIMFIVNSVYTYGGEQRVGIELMNALCETYDIMAVTKETTSQKQPYKINDRVKIYSVPYTRRNTFVNYLKIALRRLNFYFGLLNHRQLAKVLLWAGNHKEYYDKIIDYVNKERADFVIALSGGYCVLLDRISKETNAKTIIWMHNSYEAYFETPKKYCWNQKELFKIILPKLSRCVVLNEYIRDRYKENFGVDCEVIYNPRSFKSEKKAELCKNRFIAAGRMTYAKGFDLLIESFQRFCVENKTWNLVILGDGDCRMELKDKVRRAGLDKRVVFTGFTDDVKHYMLDSSVFLLTSRWEGFPMVITEALELGLPVIAYDITAMHPLVTNGVEGILVKAFDTEQYAQEMLKLAENKEIRQTMSDNGIKKAGQWSIEVIVKQWEEMFHKIESGEKQLK